MAYGIKDTAKVKHMFEGWENIFDIVDVEIRIFVTDPDAPRSVLVSSSCDGIFLAAEGTRDCRRGKADSVVHRGRDRTILGRSQHDLGTSGGKVGVSVRPRICVLLGQQGAASYGQKSG